MTDEGSKQGILSRIAQTVVALSKPKTIWKDKKIDLSSKIRMMRSLVISIFQYAYETPNSRVREVDTSYRNEMPPKTFGHLLQISRYELRSQAQYQARYWAI